MLSRRDVDRFLTRARLLTAPSTAEPLSENSRRQLVKGVSMVVPAATAMAFFPGLHPTFSFRRGDGRSPVVADEPGRALPAHVVAQLDAQLDLLRTAPGLAASPEHRSRGALGERAVEFAVLAYLLLKRTGRRLGELASLRLDCLDVDETAKPVLVYDNHKAGRKGRFLTLADSSLVEAIRAQQWWVVERFPDTPGDRLWLMAGPFLAASTEAATCSGRFWHDRRPRWEHRLPWTRPAGSALEGDELWDWCIRRAARSTWPDTSW